MNVQVVKRPSSLAQTLQGIKKGTWTLAVKATPAGGTKEVYSNGAISVVISGNRMRVVR
jgi:hypothetical protein